MQCCAYIKTVNVLFIWPFSSTLVQLNSQQGKYRSVAINNKHHITCTLYTAALNILSPQHVIKITSIYMNVDMSSNHVEYRKDQPYHTDDATRWVTYLYLEWKFLSCMRVCILSKGQSIASVTPAKIADDVMIAPAYTMLYYLLYYKAYTKEIIQKLYGRKFSICH